MADPQRDGNPRGLSDDVLVVEDDPQINELVGAYAQLAGFEYRRALTGTAALDEVTRRAPRVIILDVMLPDLDGFEVCRRIKQQQQAAGPGARVPIIFLTAMDNEASRRKGMECGAVEYMTKPFDPDHLIASLERLGHAEPGGT
jgi:two-component system OmpR family response regulator